jgi:hypothetical protein
VTENLAFDPFEVLGVRPDADITVIRAAYRALARQLHPDSNPAEGATESMTVLNRAMEALEGDLHMWRQRVTSFEAGSSRHSVAGDDLGGGDAETPADVVEFECPTCDRLIVSPPGKLRCRSCEAVFEVDPSGFVVSASDPWAVDETVVAKRRVVFGEAVSRAIWITLGAHFFWLALSPIDWIHASFSFSLPTIGHYFSTLAEPIRALVLATAFGVMIWAYRVGLLTDDA